MKTFVLISSFLLLTAPALAGDHPASGEHPKAGKHSMATESGWFDMANCGFCKNLLTDPGLMEHITWETHKTESGMMYVSTCDPQYAESYAKANAAMNKLGTDMMSGAVNPMGVKMCGSCSTFGQLMMAGIKMENIDGEAADITLFSSTDPALITRMHEFADRNTKEMAAMMTSDHGGH